MKINVYQYPSSTWVLDGDTFFCTHDEWETDYVVEDHMGFHGHYQTETKGYFCADPDCGEALDGSFLEDNYEEDYDDRE